jgi:gamma-glutamylcyclotransferase (GGCT)/AIG2-like uncharacterized protein YtfP
MVSNWLLLGDGAVIDRSFSRRIVDPDVYAVACRPESSLCRHADSMRPYASGLARRNVGAKTEGMKAALFTYGSLEITELVRALTGRRFQSQAAVLEGFSRSMLKERPYPAIRRALAASVRGRLYLDVDQNSLRLVDLFEAREYERCEVQVTLPSAGRVVAWAYVLRPEFRHLLIPKRWDQHRFRRTHLAGYLETCTALRRNDAFTRRLREGPLSQ